MNWLAKLGQNIQFVAFVAHAAVAYAAILTFDDYAWQIATGFVLFAAVKEFWFDARYETDPPQTFDDNLQDFLGYVIGSVLGLIVVYCL